MSGLLPCSTSGSIGSTVKWHTTFRRTRLCSTSRCIGSTVECYATFRRTRPCSTRGSTGSTVEWHTTFRRTRAYLGSTDLRGVWSASHTPSECTESGYPDSVHSVGHQSWHAAIGDPYRILYGLPRILYGLAWVGPHEGVGSGPLLE